MQDDKTTLTPFADDQISMALAGLTIENGTDQITIYGSISITKDKIGLTRATALKQIVEAIEAELRNTHPLRDNIPQSDPTVPVNNPFL